MIVVRREIRRHIPKFFKNLLPNSIRRFGGQRNRCEGLVERLSPPD